MLKNISYNDSKVFDEINNYVGKPYTIFQRLRIGGIGSSKLMINKPDSKISNLLNLDNNINKCKEKFLEFNHTQRGIDVVSLLSEINQVNDAYRSLISSKDFDWELVPKI